ncbi:MAG: heterocyst formation ABC transporter subunit HepA [Cyanobacteria bacterium P01_A01_bin.45]
MSKKSSIVKAFQPFYPIAAIAVIFTLVGAILEACGVGLIASLLQGLTNPEQSPFQTGIGWFDVWFLGTKSNAMQRVYRVSGLILATVWARSIFSYFGRYCAKLCEAGLIDALRRKLFNQFEQMSLKEYSKSRSGELINIFCAEVSQISIAFNEIINFVTKSCIIFAYALAMCLISPQLTLAIVLLFGLLAAGAANLIRRVRTASFEVTAYNNDLSSAMVEFINGIKTVKAFWTQDYERKRFEEIAQHYKQAWLRSHLFSSMVQPVVEAIATTILIGVILVSVSLLVSRGQLHIISLLAFLFALFRLLPIIAHINSSWGIIATHSGSINIVERLLQTEDKVYLQDGNLEFPGIERKIEFVDISFGYTPNQPVLQNINFTIERGQMLALVGASGSGKTTLADLLMRFYEPTSGGIFIDGMELSQYKLASLRHSIAVVSQDTFIFNTSVRNNIAYGLNNIDDRAISEAAKQANALEFILNLPDKFDTKLGDRGVLLSGGQRQRIAIARALLRNPEILILDEATSALDSVSERLVQESLEKLAQGRTTIAIAHRLSTIFRADKIIVIEEGRVIEEGKYQELVEKRGKFWKYHQMQHDFGQVN